jgi:hypothetical protein
VSQPSDYSLFSPYVLTKARKLRARGGIARDLEHADIWWAWGNDSSGPYRVQLYRSGLDPERGAVGIVTFVTCTCEHGLKQGAGLCHCYHVAAVLMELDENGTPAMPPGLTDVPADPNPTEIPERTLRRLRGALAPEEDDDPWHD